MSSAASTATAGGSEPEDRPDESAGGSAQPVTRGRRLKAWLKYNRYGRGVNITLLPLFGGLVALVIFGFHVRTGPDFTSDEVLYTTIGQHAVAYNSISTTFGPLLVHPPVFFLLVAGWQLITGTAHSTMLDAMLATRYLNVVVCAIIVALVGALTRMFIGPTRRYRVETITATAMLLAVTDAFFLRFGRTVLIEPTAVLAGLLIVIAFFKLRDRPAVVQIAVVGCLIGVGCLVKQTVTFAALEPLVAALLLRNREQIRRAVASLVLGGVFWLVFPLWAAASGLGGALLDQEKVSIERLLGILQVTGVNNANDSPVTLLLSTLTLYISSYVVLLLGGLGLVMLIFRSGIFRARLSTTNVRLAHLVAYSFLAYLFVSYSFLFGQGNEQLTMYAVPAAAMMCVLPGTYLRRLTRFADYEWIPAVLVFWLFVGLGTWLHFFAGDKDNGTNAMAQYIKTSLSSVCTQINATGDQDRWQTAITTQQVTGYPNGPQALANNVHYFLLSPKDSRNHYGNSSPDLAAWVMAHGSQVYDVPSQTYEDVQLWLVGTDQGAPARANCAIAQPIPHDNASAERFVVFLFGALGVVAVGATTIALRPGRRRRSADVEPGLTTPPSTPPSTPSSTPPTPEL